MLVPEAGRIHSYPIKQQWLLYGAMLVLALLAFGSWGAYSVYQTQQLLTDLRTSQQALQVARERQNDEQLGMQLRMDSEQKKLSVYARKLGQLQARVLRLDSLGEHLVEVSKLDKSDFDFTVKPGLGGPRIASASVAALNMDEQMHHMNSQLTHLDAQLAAIDMILQDGREEKLARPHAWPTEGGWLSSHFGIRTDPFTGRQAMHRGLDLANRFGAPVLAASRGVVVFAGKMKGYGYMIEVEHGYGYRTRYGHMSSVVVKAGDEVADNQLIGRVGSSGRSTGPHLHFEVRRFGKAIDPVPFLPHT